jgi:hypothetical protein
VKCGSAASALSHSISTFRRATDQAELGKMLAQGVDLAGIAAIERGKGGQGIESHGRHPFR